MFLQICYVTIMLFTQIYSFKTEVKLKLGKIIGTTEATIFEGRMYNAFYGVPYAQPPVGKLRFKNPKPPKKWKTPLDATTEYHGACAQAQIVHKHALYGVEDCLYLNIYTPMVTKRSNFKLKPVLVYIHGYAFASSLSHIYGADFFIDQDVVVISASHRIGVFGFIKLNETDSHANMGLRDIVMALKWIRKYIKQFGGDKNNITVMGSDSGATFLSLLLMTKHKNLFTKIILQSGTIFSPSLFQTDFRVEKERLQKNLRIKGIKDILSASTNDIVAASQKIYSSKEYINFQKPVVPFTPILEEKSNLSLLTYSPDKFYEDLKDQNVNLKMIVGFNSRESISELIPFIHNPKYLKSFTSYFKFMIPFTEGCVYNYTTSLYNDISTQIKQYYFKNGISENSLDDFLQYTTDLKIHPIWKFIQANLHSKATEMFVYKFNYVGAFNAVKATSVAGVNSKVRGASNGDELCYIFKCEPLWEHYVNIHNDTNSRDRIFIKTISEMWANFVKKGNPTPYSDRIVWQPMTSNQSNLLHLGNVTKLIPPNSETKMYRFWNKLYETMYLSNNCKDIFHEEL